LNVVLYFELMHDIPIILLGFLFDNLLRQVINSWT